MDFVPFISSGASSRSHYVLARKIESAPSVQAIDDILLAEIQSLAQKLGGSNISLVSLNKYVYAHNRLISLIDQLQGVPHHSTVLCHHLHYIVAR